MTRPLLVAAGGAHVDRRGRLAGLFVPGASNVGHLVEDMGGAVFNALRNAVGHGVDGMILSLRGGDAAGEQVAAAIENAGIADLSATFLDRTSPSYTALLDREGELIAGLSDMALYELGFPKQVQRRAFRDAVRRADAILVDANLPEDAIMRVAHIAQAVPLHAIAVAPAKAPRLAPVIDRLDCLFMNIREARMLAGLPEASAVSALETLAARGLRRGVVTSGNAPVIGLDEAGLFAIEPPAPRAVVDVTGAGDSLTGAAVAAMMNGRGFRPAVREGLAAALLTIESGRSVAGWSCDDLAATLPLVPEAIAVA